MVWEMRNHNHTNYHLATLQERVSHELSHTDGDSSFRHRSVVIDEKQGVMYVQWFP